MKKFLILACVAILCLPLFIFAAVAHSGRTDSNGGHYDHSVGEYHYHHGESAHSHYDINGDGVDDCPYEFTSKTIIAFLAVMAAIGIIVIIVRKIIKK